MWGNAKILLVDDDESNLRLLEGILSQTEYDLETATTGEQAIEKVQNDENIRVMVLDIMMPGLNGYEVIEHLQQEDMKRDLGIIILTSLDFPEEKAKGLKVGADDFLTKPVYAPELIGRVKNQLEIRLGQKFLKEAFSGVNRLLTYSEEMVGSFELMYFDYQKAEEGLVKSSFGKAPEELQPKNLYVFHTDEKSSRKGSLYLLKNGDLVQHSYFPAKMEKVLARLKPGQENNFSNPGETERIPGIPRELAGKIGKINNQVAYRGDSILVLTFNYPANVGALHAHLVKSFTQQLQLYKSIYKQNREVRRSFTYTAGALARAAEAVDGETGYHIRRVGFYSYIVGREIGMSRRKLEEITFSAQMHDVGKMKIPQEILQKPGPLTDEEF